jgi:hypothetical protein
MVDTKDNSKEEPKTPMFSYEKEGERVDVEASTFSSEGQEVYMDLIADREDEQQLRKVIRRNSVKLGDLIAGVKKRSDWLIENEINKAEEETEAEEVEVIEDAGDNKTKQ